jgi:hypothetical protein
LTHLRTYGFTDEQLPETVLMVALAKFANLVAYELPFRMSIHPERLPG